MSSPARGVGIDFGTTNSALAVSEGGAVQMATFPFLGSVVDTFRSVLFFENTGKQVPPKPVAGPRAIEAYLRPHEGGRLMQSLKSFAASSTFEKTTINGRPWTLEELIGFFLRAMRVEAEAQLGPLGESVLAGRPVCFVGGEKAENEQRALDRLRRAFAIAGFTDVRFEYEPIGAAESWAQRLEGEELVLIADFGGGTSDFSLLRFRSSGTAGEIIGNSGAPIGGDTFDARLIRHLVSPLLGLGTEYKSVNKKLPVPASLFRKLESWHHLSFLRSRENIRLIEGLRAQADEPEMLARLLEIVQEDLGYHLHRAVGQTKVDLSVQNVADFAFTDASVDIHTRVLRSDFEQWISPELEEIRKAVSQLLERTGTSVSSIDRVFLTGGSSLVPAVRNIFIDGFGQDRIAAGDEFTSVARGLALRAATTRQ